MPNTVLIVDDSPTTAPELKSLLESQGYTVLTALRAEEALDTLRSTSVDLIIAEALLPGMDGFELVRQIRRNEEWAQMPIIILTVKSAPEDYAASYEAGADEYFLKPMEPMKIIAATRGLMTKYQLQRRNPQGPMPGRGQIAMPTLSEKGKVITCFSLKGGVGTSTLAVNLAVAIKTLAPSSRVGLIDLALEEGADALLLDVIPTSTISEWAREDIHNATPYQLNQYFVQHRSGISLLSAPPTPEQAETVRPDAVRKTLELAPQAFDYVVVDTASTFSENSLIALEAADNIFLVLTPDMAALKTAANALRILKAVNISGNRIQIVMNEIIPHAGLTKTQVESSLAKDVFSLPHAGGDFIESANQGMPLVTVLPAAPATRAMFELAKSVAEVETEEPLQAAKPSALPGLLDRIRRST